jgi:hypothetical protein
MAVAIARALERRNKTGVERIAVLHGGIGPAPRRRALAALRLEDIAKGRTETTAAQWPKIRGRRSRLGVAIV